MTAGGDLSEEAIELTFELTEDDVLALCRHSVADTAGTGLGWGCLFAIGLLSLCLGIIFFVAVMSDSPGAAGPAILFTVCGSVAIWLFLRGDSAGSRAPARAAQRLLDSGYGRLSLRPMRITVDRERIATATDISTFSTRWIGVFHIDVAEDDHHIFIYIGTHSAIIIPQRAFASAGDFHQFAQRVRHYRQHAPDVRARCPDCGYDLRSSDQRGCPECGWDR